MKKFFSILIALTAFLTPLPVLAEDSSSDSVLPVVFGVLALVGIIIFLILGITVTVVAHNTDENSDGL